ncbi:MAG TPA: prepilin-type N-terminal cleavage/methylation domain-containing protein [Rickettsiales bacterium]|nr:prepilin-type N-terminal cleavage/methylation domain-containing protein [Rickettsiales bacterium]
MPLRSHFPRNGFTLIELSIVLVIIGLIVGGILAGRDLIRASELNYIISQIGKYDTAAQTFRNKYGQIPGDATNAVQFFGNAGGNASDNYTTSCMNMMSTSTNSQTCNGDGNGTFGGGGPGPANVEDDEGLLFWHHLSMAKLIDAGGLTARHSYLNSGSSSWVLTGLNVPGSRISSNAGFSAFYLCVTTGSSYFLNGFCNHAYFYGAQDTGANNNYLGINLYPVMSALDAYSIDKKIDNALPATGTVMSLPPTGAASYQNNCTSSSTVATATYTVTNSGITCSLIFKAGF